MRFQTKAIHVGQDPEPRTGAVTVPIYQTSTFAQDDIGIHRGHEYSRSSNPTRDAYQDCLAALESAQHGLAFSSGMGAITSVTSLLSRGDHVVCGDDVYGGTFRVFDKVFRRFGIEFSFVDASNPDAVTEAMRDTTKMVWVESPTNPMLKVSDIRALAERCRDRGVLLGVDNTFMSPALQRPLELGATLVMHSTTKYVGGHSDVVGGFVATNDDDLAERLAFIQNAMGAVCGPFDAWLTLRGIKTLGLRMERHEANARRVAEFLDGHARVERVIWPGLPSHPGHELQRSQADGFGGIVSFYVEGGLEAARRVCRETKYFFLAESLGGVESLIEHPAIMTHASVPAETRAALGITDAFLRLSVGVEDGEDLIEDLDRALSASA